MANQYDTNLKLQAIADAIGDTQSSGLISALEDIADAVAGGGGGGSSITGLVSDNFSDSNTYNLGDYCIHNNTLYVCINAITTPGPWDLSDWQATNSGIELSSLNSAKADKTELTPLKVYRLEGNVSSAGTGNFRINNLPSGAVPIAIGVETGTDCNYTLFQSTSTHAWYIHASNFSTGDSVGATITKCYIFYVQYTNA